MKLRTTPLPDGSSLSRLSGTVKMGPNGALMGSAGEYTMSFIGIVNLILDGRYIESQVCIDRRGVIRSVWTKLRHMGHETLLITSETYSDYTVTQQIRYSLFTD